MPAEVQPMKVIVASPSRYDTILSQRVTVDTHQCPFFSSGTLGLYQAMQILGFRTYHLYECIANRGLSHMKVFEEAVTAEHDSLSGIKKYKKADYEGWLGDYDCIVEAPSYLGTGLIEAYVHDPNVKFILTERDPKKWVTSINNTIGPNVELSRKFPFVILKHFDATLFHTHVVIDIIYRVMSGGTALGDAENTENMQQHYEEYIRRVKETVPTHQLCHIRLEDGLGWENICPFLGLPVPEQAYPDRNEPGKMQQLTQEMFKPMLVTAVIKLSAFVVPAVGITWWATINYGPMAVAALGKTQ
ncbi:unnamed protein product [Penicillium salamii]|uniref:Uncharacterized protein n=1 Tax=Penicillium salamii TaxID=1612424 RepID=A0A9W4N3R9_9EURO|nr:unnamed protein product [Penicillium salamii]